jgi:hypothetical protein
MSETQDFSGWSNYPTWCVNLWLSHDERVYKAMLDRLKIHAPLTGPSLHVAEALKHLVRLELAPSLGATLAGDLLGYALDQVNWLELAESWAEAR